MQLVVLAAGLGRRFGGLKQLFPVGPSGEAILDYTAYDALAAGFAELILVVRPDVAPEITAHTARWPVSARFALQEGELPLGTAHALLAARPLLDGDTSFAVANADDLYGREALSALRHHLGRTEEEAATEHAVVAFPAGASFVGNGPVRRALCEVDEAGLLVSVRESDLVRGAGGGVELGDGGRASRFDTDTLVSMNLWGFRSSVWPHLDRANRSFGRDEAPGGELRLPDVVDAMLSAPMHHAVRALRGRGRCVGLTHSGDEEDVAGAIGSMIEAGRYPRCLWEGA